jgi:hypothetical protein
MTLIMFLPANVHTRATEQRGAIVALQTVITLPHHFAFFDTVTAATAMFETSKCATRAASGITLLKAKYIGGYNEGECFVFMVNQLVMVIRETLVGSIESRNRYNRTDCVPFSYSSCSPSHLDEHPVVSIAQSVACRRGDGFSGAGRGRSCRTPHCRGDMRSSICRIVDLR